MSTKHYNFILQYTLYSILWEIWQDSDNHFKYAIYPTINKFNAPLHQFTTASIFGRSASCYIAFSLNAEYFVVHIISKLNLQYRHLCKKINSLLPWIKNFAVPENVGLPLEVTTTPKQLIEEVVLASNGVKIEGWYF